MRLESFKYTPLYKKNGENNFELFEFSWKKSPLQNLPSISPFPPPRFYSRFLYRDLRCFKFKILTHTHLAYTQISEFDFVKIAAQVVKS